MLNGSWIFRNRMLSSFVVGAVILSGCAGMKKIMGHDTDSMRSTPIVNPFGAVGTGSGGENKNVVLRTRKGDRSIEIELPSGDQSLSEFVIPVSPAFEKGGRNPAAVGESGIDESYAARKSSYSDREITRTFPQGTPENVGMKRE